MSNTPCYEPHTKLIWESYLLESCVAREDRDMALRSETAMADQGSYPSWDQEIWLSSNTVMFSLRAPLGFPLPWLRILIECPEAGQVVLSQHGSSIWSAGNLNISHTFWVDPTILSNSIADSCCGTAFMLYSSYSDLGVVFLLGILQELKFCLWIIFKS